MNTRSARARRGLLAFVAALGLVGTIAVPMVSANDISPAGCEDNGIT